MMRELECNRVLLMMALISCIDVFMLAFELKEDKILIFTVI